MKVTNAKTKTTDNSVTWVIDTSVHRRIRRYVSANLAGV
jgi:hypothetical protein